MALAGAILLLAADPTGVWTGDQPGPNGNTYNITFKLKADGGKLTGTMGGEQFEQPIQNGEIHGDDISFTVHLEFGDGIDLKYTGKVAADKIDFKVQRSGDDNAQPFVAKKTPAGRGADIPHQSHSGRGWRPSVGIAIRN